MESSSPHSCLPFLREQLSALRNSDGQPSRKNQARRRLQALSEFLSLGDLQKVLNEKGELAPGDESQWLSLCFPDSGVFVNGQGMVISGASDPGVIRSFAQGVYDLELPAAAQEILHRHPGSRCVLFDWRSQVLDWSALGDRWEQWRSRILFSSPVDFPVELLGNCQLAHFLILDQGFHLDGLVPLPLKGEQPAHAGPPADGSWADSPAAHRPAPSQGSSFLARAESLKRTGPVSKLPKSKVQTPEATPAYPEFSAETLPPLDSFREPVAPETSASYDDEIGEELPMIPFTLQDMKNRNFAWPTGVENIQVSMVKTPGAVHLSDPASPEDYSSLSQGMGATEEPEGFDAEIHLSNQKKRGRVGKRILGVVILVLAAATGFYLWYCWGGAAVLPDLKLPLWFKG